MKRSLGLRFALVASGIVMAAGSCGGSSESGGGASSGPTIEEAAKLVSQAYCETISGCYGPLLDKDVMGIDCMSYLGPQMEEGAFAGFEKSVEAGKASYHADKVQACIDAIKAQGCDADTHRGPDACEEVFVGTVDEGGECSQNIECKSGLTCNGAKSCPATCQPLAKTGQSCGEDDNCEDGLKCQEGKCVKPVQQGEACGESTPDCAAGLVCMGKDKKTPGTCKPVSEMYSGAPGDTCDLQKGPWCEFDAACVIESVQPKFETKCEARVASGADCKFGAFNPCPANEYCDADIKKGEISGKCQKLPGEGESCVKGYFLPCLPGLVCDDDDKCKSRKHLGDDCTSNLLCYSGNCKDGKCVPGDVCSAAKNSSK